MRARHPLNRRTNPALEASMRVCNYLVAIVSISSVLVAATAATGCKKDSKKGGGGAIALLLPESQTARYEAADRPFFEAKFKELCPGVEVVLSLIHISEPTRL